jgi:hypothetical protein
MSKFIIFKFNPQTSYAAKKVYLNDLKKIPILDIIVDLKDLDNCKNSIKYRYQKTTRTNLNNSKQNYIAVAKLLITFVADERFDEICLENIYAPDGIMYTSFVNYLDIPADFWNKLPIDDDTRSINGMHISSLWIYATRTLPPKCYVPKSKELLDEYNTLIEHATGPFSVRLPSNITEDFYEFML